MASKRKRTTSLENETPAAKKIDIKDIKNPTNQDPNKEPPSSDAPSPEPDQDPSTSSESESDYRDNDIEPKLHKLSECVFCHKVFDEAEGGDCVYHDPDSFLQIDTTSVAFNKLTQQEKDALEMLDEMLDHKKLTEEEKKFFVWGCCRYEMDDPGCIEDQHKTWEDIC
ncbi:hypothetical protein BLS_006545 [Venturia inaequalis]|uniref:Uncharacterized protein n=1 Tax=Venturia inaequalis TaxID=5025 RepID=A0A8H3YPT3_VENIN|nr:hypothetical protein EG328_009910 [Venturia inaequalis]KAE9967162.1 hypothetical protein BLS_006545 [Venturia inaequalis]KAE9993231.1 hypothetical protein EG327_005838 [Venturia inaequalis]